MAFARVKEEMDFDDSAAHIDTSRVNIERTEEIDEISNFSQKYSVAHIDTAHVKIERTDERDERSDFSQTYEDDLTITAESIVVKEEFTIQALKQEVQCSPDRCEEHSKSYNSLGELDNEESILTKTSLNLEDTKNETATFKRAEGRSKSKPANTARKGHKCLISSKSFKRRRNLEMHMRVHSWETPFECNECRTHFSRKHYLRYHMNIHTGDRPYSCSICSKAFNHYSNIQQHVRTHTAEKPYKCSQCPKTFTQKYNMKEHLRTHTGDKPYTCCECQKAFRHKYTIKNAFAYAHG